MFINICLCVSLGLGGTKTFVYKLHPMWDKIFHRKPEKAFFKKDSICSAMFIAALFVIVRTWKQPECPLTEEWIKICYFGEEVLLLSPQKMRGCGFVLG